jgi:hypothetical protein
MKSAPSESPSARAGARHFPSIPNWIHCFAWGGILGLVFLVVGISHLYDGQNFWASWTEAKELRRPAYMEQIYPDNFLRTRANSWSNLAYVMVGLYAIGLGFHDMRRNLSIKNSYLANTGPMSFLFGGMCCYLGFGSGFFHASLTRLGQRIDVASMYAPLMALIAINLAGWLPRIKPPWKENSFPTWPILTLVVLIASYLLYRYKWSMSSVKVLSTLILSMTILSVLEELVRRRRKTFTWLIFAVATLVSARACWELDVAKKFSAPDSCLQGHAIWHFLTALSLGGLYFYYRLGDGHRPD